MLEKMRGERNSNRAPITGLVTILAAAVGVLVTLAAVTVTPDDPIEPIAAPPDTAGATRYTTAPSPPSTTAGPLTGPSTGSNGPPSPTGTIVVIPRDLLPTTREEADPAITERSASTTLANLSDRLRRKLGSKERRADDGGVEVTSRDGTLTVSWNVRQPDPEEDTQNEDATMDARGVELRRDLRRVLRVLAGSTLPQSTSTVVIRATVDDDAHVEEATVVLQAVLLADTLAALDADDVRLTDATLPELLGLAIVVVGDPAWGVPVVHPPSPTAGDPLTTSLTTTLPRS